MQCDAPRQTDQQRRDKVRVRKSTVSKLGAKRYLDYFMVIDKLAVAKVTFQGHSIGHRIPSRGLIDLYTVSQKNCATFIFTVTLANVGRFLKFFQCQNQKEIAHNKNEKFPTVA